MIRFGWIAAGIMLAAAAPAETPWVGEMLLPAADPAFVLGWVAPPPAVMREYVPRGERVEAWTRMVTIQSLPYRPGLSARAVLERIAGGMRANCPGAQVSPATPAPLGSHDGARMTSVCPHNPQTGKPETTGFRAVIGDEAVHIVQAALRRDADATDARWATARLDGAILCASNDPAPRCAAARAAAIGGGLN